jgi:hypothetical protein
MGRIVFGPVGTDHPDLLPTHRAALGEAIQLAVLIVAPIVLVITLVAGIRAVIDDDREPSTALPEGVEVYDIIGDSAPEFAKIEDELLAVPLPSKEAWWVPFVPFFGTVIAALLAAGAVVWTGRGRHELEDRVAALEAKLRNGSP